LTDRGETCCPRHTVNETNSKKRECAGRVTEKEIFQTRFGRAHICFVERGHDIKRETGQLEPDEDHEELFAADEKHESNRPEE
jgi:hypothetical protein